jgi:hypothetical protein
VESALVRAHRLLIEAGSLVVVVQVDPQHSTARSTMPRPIDRGIISSLMVMLVSDGQRFDVVLRDLGVWGHQRQSFYLSLGEEHPIEPILDLGGECGVVRKPPEHDMCVEAQAHARPKSRAMTRITSGESQSAAMASWPGREPRPTLSTLRFNGITFATGVPARLMMIYSPCSTRSMIRERFVFAS